MCLPRGAVCQLNDVSSALNEIPSPFDGIADGRSHALAPEQWVQVAALQRRHGVRFSRRTKSTAAQLEPSR